MKRLICFIFILLSAISCGKKIQNENESTVDYSNSTGKEEIPKTQSAQIMKNTKELHQAILSEDLIFVKLALKQPVDYTYTNIHGENALTLAFKLNRTDIMKVLIRQETNLNLFDKNNDNAFLLACKDNRLSIVQMMINLGVNINLQNALGQNCLMLSLLKEHYRLARYLMISDADVTIRDQYSQSIFDIEIKDKNTKNFISDIKKFSNKKVSYKDYISLINLKRTYSLEYFTKKNKGNLSIFKGHNILYYIMQNTEAFYHTLYAKYFISMGVSIHSDDYYQDPLLFAAETANFPMLRFLIRLGADVNKRRYDGKNALIMAVKQLDYKSILLLAEYNVETKYSAYNGRYNAYFDACRYLPRNESLRRTTLGRNYKSKVTEIKKILRCN